MKILITKQFNDAVGKLNRDDQRVVYSLFTRLESSTKEQIFRSGKAIKIKAPGENIFMIREKFVRVFFTFATEGNSEDIILLDVIRKNSAHLKLPFNLARRSS